MTTAELLQPRYKVIADYPNSNIDVGDMFKDEWFYTGPKQDKFNFCDFPHLFKKLEWWEERKVEDMPEYVKDITANPIRFIKTELWVYQKEINYTYFINGELQFVNMWALQPSTEQEYNEYQSKQKLKV